MSSLHLVINSHFGVSFNFDHIMQSWWRASFPDTTGMLRRIASFRQSYCNWLFFPCVPRTLFISSSLNCDMDKCITLTNMEITNKIVMYSKQF
jgi:hypothetical protein